MNIDERLEALAQTVLLLAQMHKDNEKQRVASQQATDKELRRLGRYIHTVAGLVLDHDERLRTLEGEDEKDDDATQQ
jgi:hypothetical protein